MCAAIDDTTGNVLVAPERLVASTRADFRTAALAHLERLQPADGALAIDMRVISTSMERYAAEYLRVGP